MSDLLPKDVMTPGTLRTVSVVGRIVSQRVRDIDGDQAAGSPPRKGNGKATAKAKGKGKDKGKGKGAGPRRVHELHLVGGSTPADVIMFEAWDAGVRDRLGPVAQIGCPVRVRNCLVKTHTEKTQPYTTSRKTVFLRAVEDTQVETCTDPGDEWPWIHPVTALTGLCKLPAASLVCVAGRLVGEAPKTSTVSSHGEDALVCNAQVRVENEVIRLSGWREHAAEVEKLVLGEIYFFQAISVRPLETKEGKSSLELRLTKLTVISLCPEPLYTQVKVSTPENTTGAHAWTSLTSARDYASEKSDWYTLSMCETICAPEERRRLSLLAQVPSVFVRGFAGRITYYGCSTCKKSWTEDFGQACQCSGGTRAVFWKAVATLVDSTAQVQATLFDAIAGIIGAVVDDDDMERSEPSFYDEPAHIDALLSRVGAIPFTCVFSFEDNDYDTHPQLIARLVKPTFDEKHGVKHPLDKMVHFASTSYPCPPCALTSTKFEPSIGLTEVPGGATSSFRALLEIMDSASGARQGEGGTALRVTRRCVCALRSVESAQTYQLVQNGPLEITTLLLQVRKSDYIHAIVTWRAQEELTLIAFWPLDSKCVTKFRQFFIKECELHGAMALGSELKLSHSKAETPLRIAANASAAAASTQAQPWPEWTPHLPEP